MVGARSFKPSPVAGPDDVLPDTSTLPLAAESAPHVGLPHVDESGLEMAVASTTIRTSAESVYYNDLIMSEVYSWVAAPSDLVTCLQVSRAGYWTVARCLYDEMRLKAIPKLLKRGCSMVGTWHEERNSTVLQPQLIFLLLSQSRLARIMSLVKTVRC